MKTIRLAIFICISVFVARPAYSQLGFLPCCGVSYQYHYNWEEGVAFGIKRVDTANFGGYYHKFTFYPKLSCEFYFSSHNLFLGPKFSLELSKSFITTRVNIIYYTDLFNHHDLRFTPEIGIRLHSIRGAGLPPLDDIFDKNAFNGKYTKYREINICYGYNVPLGANRIFDIPGNRITITINLIPYK